MDRNFGGVIWTNHAMVRLRERGVKQGDAWATWNNPQQSRRGSVSGSWVYYRNWGTTQIEVVAKQNDKKEWIILSVWSRPSSQGSAGHFEKKYTFWDAIKQLFLNRKKVRAGDKMN